MKWMTVLFVIMFGFLILSVAAQTETIAPTDQQSQTDVSDTSGQENAAEAQASPVPESETLSKAPRKYPIAAGVWYPGEPVPTVASRYYRIRCWPGCHSYGEWTGPVNPEKTAPEAD